MNFLQDAQGDLSSKRLMGIIAMGLGIIIYSLLGILGLFKAIGDVEAVKSAAFGLTGFGASLIASGIIENVQAMKK